MTSSDGLDWMRQVPAASPALLRHLHGEAARYARSAARLRPMQESLIASSALRQPAAERGPAWSVGAYTYWYEGRQDREFCTLRRQGKDSDPTDILDLNLLAGDSPYVRLGVCDPSPDGTLLAYSVDTLGDESYELRFRSVPDGAEGEKGRPRSYYGGAWDLSGTHYFYVTHDEAYRPYQVWRYTVGAYADTDELYLEEQDPQFHITTYMTETHLVISAASRTTSQEWIVDLANSDQPPRDATGRTTGVIHAVTPIPGIAEDELLIVTNASAATDFRLAHGRIGQPVEDWATLLPTVPGRRLHRATLVSGHVVVQCRRDISPRLITFPWGSPDVAREISPDVPQGTLRMVSAAGLEPDEIAIETESYLDPKRVESVSLSEDRRRTLWTRTIDSYERSRFVSQVLDCTVRDGTTVPVTLVRHSGTALDRTAPCLLYGYGAWETVIEPAFDPGLIALLEHGVVFAHAHVRGGGELGREWWQAGSMSKKENSVFDYIDVAEWLGQNWVDPWRIVARGRSAGGLLVGAAYSLSPATWAGVIAEVPFVDPVTTMLDADAPLVAVEREEWGDPRRSEDREWMLRWSPCDNLPPRPVRPPLIVTSFVHDSRVSVAEPARWVEALRQTGSGDDDVMFRVELAQGAHAIPPGRGSQLRYMSELYAWALDRMGY